jgi:LPXTG-site transpeptidase (sortase) family protein
VTRDEGNVFRDLNKVQLGAPIEVYTDRSRFRYQVEEIKLAYPEDVDVMAPTQDARLTLITCAGTFDPRKGSFSDRLIVIGVLVQGERLSSRLESRPAST